MTKTKSIMIWGQEDLLSESVRSILKEEEDWEVVCPSCLDGYKGLVNAILENKPDVIIIQQEHNSELNRLMHYLQDNPGLKVMTVSLENNSLEVFGRETMLVKEPSDLITIIGD